VRQILYAHLGITVIDADRVAREVVAPGSDGLAAVVEALDEDVLNASGALDRSALRARITQDASDRAALEAVLHPRIHQGIQTALSALAQAGTPLAAVEAALMVETGSYTTYDELWVVICDPAVQLRRVLARDGMTDESARAFIATQLPMADKAALATELIENDGSMSQLHTVVMKAAGRARARAAAR